MESNQNGSSAAQLTFHLPREVRQRSIKDSRPYFQQVKTRKNSPIDYSNDQTDRLERTTKERNEEVGEKSLLLLSLLCSMITCAVSSLL